MKLLVNGEPRDSEAATLDALWRAETADLDLPGPQGFAIALNGAVVRQRDWAGTALSENDRVEIVRAMQGG
ncbi:sulfur carrier protein ThiS [Methylobacterium sp. SyP6R]|uniref:sulfur carrier protein ThiS n=1 Tax=Methylobacterium sp. SyP6R TaxID=2718876 RepID=UPI001F00EC14|nr:sulfur carrier protein ThiS [Methylobacterium sp. SyP6R]MCF4128667.1 sulfur carrier protein ThiS [Methylobacterium sp. SyP6R]